MFYEAFLIYFNILLLNACISARDLLLDVLLEDSGSLRVRLCYMKRRRHPIYFSKRCCCILILQRCLLDWSDGWLGLLVHRLDVSACIIQDVMPQRRRWRRQAPFSSKTWTGSWPNVVFRSGLGCQQSGCWWCIFVFIHYSGCCLGRRVRYLLLQWHIERPLVYWWIHGCRRFPLIKYLISTWKFFRITSACVWLSCKRSHLLYTSASFFNNALSWKHFDLFFLLL